MTELTTAATGAPLADADILMVRKAGVPGPKKITALEAAAYFGSAGGGGGGDPVAPAETQALVSFEGNPTVILKSYNVASVVRTATGRYRVTFTTPFADTNYFMQGMGKYSPYPDSNWVAVGYDRQGEKATTHCDIVTGQRINDTASDENAVVWFQQFSAETGTGGGTTAYRFGGFFTTTPAANEVVMMHVATDAFTLPALLAGTQVSVGINPSADTVLAVEINGVAAGTITISAAGVVTLAGVGGAVAAGDLVTVTAPASSNGLANVAFTLKGA